MGMRYKEIAAKLRIALPTVRTHIQSLYMKMDIHSKEELDAIVNKSQEEYYGASSFLMQLKRALMHSQ